MIDRLGGLRRGRWRCLICEADGGNGQPEWATSSAPAWDWIGHYMREHLAAADV